MFASRPAERYCLHRTDFPVVPETTEVPVMTPAPDQPEVLDRLDIAVRHLTYLGRRFDDTNARLAQAEHHLAIAVDDIGTHVDTALARSSRRQALTLACGLVGQSLVLLALMAGIGAWA